MILAFTLSMPRNNSWNGRWSGDERLYVILDSFRGVKGGAHAQRIIDGAPYHYSWTDGWGARIDVREVTSAEARALRKRSDGFRGYDWMVRTIIQYGQPMADHDLKAFLEARKAVTA